MERNSSRIARKPFHRFGIGLALGIMFAVAPALPRVVPSALCADTGVSSLNLVTAIQDVAKKSIPAVVHIQVTERREIPNPLAPFKDDPLFKYFFGDRKMPKKLKKDLIGLGSGVILDSQGYILTNNHVVGGATKIVVLLADGRRFSEKSVKLIGTDAKTDLAVIQIQDKGTLPTLQLGDSDTVEVGQWVVAIGHPRGLDQTVTQGIISAKHRRGISDPSGYQDFLQTDAAINPGNSGGPLLNLQGEVIGINAAIMSQSGGFEGLGFAIPSNMAAHVSKQLIAQGKVVRGWLGVSIQDLTPELAESMGVSSMKGALVSDVAQNSPAAQAGIQAGDIVIAYQGKPLENASSLQNAVAVTMIDTKVTLTVLREGKKQDITVTIGSQEELEKSLAASLKQRFGLTVRPLTQKDVDRYELESQEGVAIVSVDPGSAFGKAGFENGDLILEIDDEPVAGPDGLAAMLNGVPADTKLKVLGVDGKSGESSEVAVTIP